MSLGDTSRCLAPGPGPRRTRHGGLLPLGRAAAADLRGLLAEGGIRERLQRLVQRRELPGEAEEVLVVVEALVRLRELVPDPVEPLEDQVEAPVGEALLHALILVTAPRAPRAIARRSPSRRARPARRRASRRPLPRARPPRGRARPPRAPAPRR